MKKDLRMRIGHAPHIHALQSTASLMWGTIAALVPALVWGLYSFGLRAAMTTLAAILGALAGEALVGLVRRRFTLVDGSAFLSGLLLGLAMPPGVPLYVPAVAAFFATAFVKGAFGGLGANWMNPALAGLAFALLNWPQAMGQWVMPRQLTGIAGISGATPLGLVRESLAAGHAGSDPVGLISQAGYLFSPFDRSVTDFLNRVLFEPFGASLPSGYVDLLVGNRPGTIGEISGILLLAGSVYLLARKLIRWEIPAAIFASYALLSWVFGGLAQGAGFFAGDVLFNLFSGSFIIVAFYMATDPVTSPSRRGGMLVYGMVIGSLSFLFRCFGSRAEGSAFAVILADCALPLFEKIGAQSRRAAKAV